jgi:hypothetical protein
MFLAIFRAKNQKQYLKFFEKKENPHKPTRQRYCLILLHLGYPSRVAAPCQKKRSGGSSRRRTTGLELKALVGPRPLRHSPRPDHAPRCRSRLHSDQPAETRRATAGIRSRELQLSSVVACLPSSAVQLRRRRSATSFFLASSICRTEQHPDRHPKLRSVSTRASRVAALDGLCRLPGRLLCVEPSAIILPLPRRSAAATQPPVPSNRSFVALPSRFSVSVPEQTPRPPSSPLRQ